MEALDACTHNPELATLDSAEGASHLRLLQPCLQLRNALLLLRLHRRVDGLQRVDLLLALTNLGAGAGAAGILARTQTSRDSSP